MSATVICISSHGKNGSFVALDNENKIVDGKKKTSTSEIIRVLKKNPEARVIFSCEKFDSPILEKYLFERSKKISFAFGIDSSITSALEVASIFKGEANGFIKDHNIIGRNCMVSYLGIEPVPATLDSTVTNTALGITFVIGEAFAKLGFDKTNLENKNTPDLIDFMCDSDKVSASLKETLTKLKDTYQKLEGLFITEWPKKYVALLTEMQAQLFDPKVEFSSTKFLELFKTFSLEADKVEDEVKKLEENSKTQRKELLELLDKS